jgi:hypothetical protein
VPKRPVQLVEQFIEVSALHEVVDPERIAPIHLIERQIENTLDAGERAVAFSASRAR